MSKLAFKNRGLDAAILKEESIANDFRIRIKELQESEVVTSQDEIDLQQKSFSDSVDDEINMLADRLYEANNNLKFLNDLKYEGTLDLQVNPGALVEVNNNLFLIGISIPDFKIDEKEARGLSIDSPFYKAMEGKKEGESFVFENKKFKIITIY